MTFKTDKTNQFKGLEVSKNKPVKQVPAVQIFLVMLIILAILVGMDKLGWIELSQTQGL